MPPRKNPKSSTRQRNRASFAVKSASSVVPLPEPEVARPEEASGTLLGFLIEELEQNTTPQKFIQFMALLFISNMYYLYNKDDVKVKEDLVNVGTTLIGLVANLYFVLNYQFKKYTAAEENSELPRESKPQLPEFDLVYAVFLPLLVCLVTKPSFIPIALGCVFQITELADVAKIGISIAVQFQISGFEPEAPWAIIASSLVHFAATKAFDMLAGASLSKPEKHMFATLLVSLFFGVDSESQVSMIILQKLAIAFIVCLALITPVYQIAVKQKPLARNALFAVIYVSFVSTFYFASKYQLSYLGMHPLAWLREFLAQGDRTLILKVWIGSLALLIPTVFVFADSWALDCRRKVWHFTIVALLVHPLINDPQFVSLSLVGAIGLFLLVELIRSLRLPPVGGFVADILDKFRDKRDKTGPLVISYIFLILGLSLPLFWSGVVDTAAVSGLIAVGLGDSSASLVGARIGSHKWWDSSKTIEGTIAYIVACTVGLVAFNEAAHVEYSVIDLLVSSVVAGGLEAVSDINDNIVVPAVMYVTLKIFTK